MDTTMELDDFKSAWTTLDARLARNEALNVALLRDRKLGRTRSSLRPLFSGQLVQMLFGLLLVVIAVAFWRQHRDVPVLLGMGVLLHAFGIVTMIAGGATLGAIARIDYAAPVVAIQTQLARLRRTYVVGGMVAGLGWWFMWMPFTTAVFALLGKDFTGVTLALYVPGTLIGIAGMSATWWFHRWSRAPGRERLARALEHSLTGASLRRAQAQLDEIAAFEKE